MKRRAVIENAIGEVRAAVYEGRKLVELHVQRVWDTSPRPGDHFTARVIKVDPSVAGAFVDLGAQGQALLPFAAQRDLPKLVEGILLDVKVLRCPAGSKGAVVKYFGEGSQPKAGAVKQLSLQERLAEKFEGIEFDEGPVSAIDEAVERTLALKGGGTITFDQTQALLAIDVDKGAAETALSASLAAADMIASQMRLRGLGGLVVVDYPNLRQPKQRNQLQRAFERAFEKDAAITKFANISRFGTIEMTRAKPDASLDEIIGAPSIATQSLRVLRRLTREAQANAGAQLTLTVPADVQSWLDAAPFDWHAELIEKIGARFTVKLGDKIDVSADR